jgi:hypothetical protein
VNKEYRRVIYVEGTALKECCRCRTTFPIGFFSKRTLAKDGRESYCKLCASEYGQESFQGNKEARLIKGREAHKANRERNLATLKIYYQKNKKNIIKMIRKSCKERFLVDPGYRVTRNLRNRLWYALKGKNKGGHMFDLLGCTLEFLWKHLEEAFLPGMTRSNYGVWHIDHIRPIDSFDNLSDVEQQKICFHYTNLQPLWGRDNLSKGGSRNLRCKSL